MSQLKFFKVVVIILILVNLGMVAFFFISRPPQRHHAPHDSIHQMLKLTAEQETKFTGLVKQHQVEMKEINKKQKHQVMRYLSQLEKESANQSHADAMEEIKQLEAQKIQSTYNHFQAVKKILTEEQIPYFHDFMDQALRNILGNSKKMPPPPRDF